MEVGQPRHALFAGVAHQLGHEAGVVGLGDPLGGQIVHGGHAFEAGNRKGPQGRGRRRLAMDEGACGAKAVVRSGVVGLEVALAQPLRGPGRLVAHGRRIHLHRAPAHCAHGLVVERQPGRKALGVVLVDMVTEHVVDPAAVAAEFVPPRLQAAQQVLHRGVARHIQPEPVVHEQRIRAGGDVDGGGAVVKPALALELRHGRLRSVGVHMQVEHQPSHPVGHAAEHRPLQQVPGHGVHQAMQQVAVGAGLEVAQRQIGPQHLAPPVAAQREHRIAIGRTHEHPGRIMREAVTGLSSVQRRGAKVAVDQGLVAVGDQLAPAGARLDVQLARLDAQQGLCLRTGLHRANVDGFLAQAVVQGVAHAHQRRQARMALGKSAALGLVHGRIEVDPQQAAPLHMAIELADQQVGGPCMHQVGQDHARHRLAVGHGVDEVVAHQRRQGHTFFAGHLQPGLCDRMRQGLGIGQQQHQLLARQLPCIQQPLGGERPGHQRQCEQHQCAEGQSPSSAPAFHEASSCARGDGGCRSGSSAARTGATGAACTACSGCITVASAGRRLSSQPYRATNTIRSSSGPSAT